MTTAASTASAVNAKLPALVVTLDAAAPSIEKPPTDAFISTPPAVDVIVTADPLVPSSFNNTIVWSTPASA